MYPCTTESYGWLARETPLAVPARTPVRVRTASENCRFALDAITVRLVYLGGFGFGDPHTPWWSIVATFEPHLMGIDAVMEAMHPTWQAAAATSAQSGVLMYAGLLGALEESTGYSRRRLTEILQTSHTTLNGICNNPIRAPRPVLAARLSSLARLVKRLEDIYGRDAVGMQQLLETRSLEGRSALEFIAVGDYPSAATAAQWARTPPTRFKRLPQGRVESDATVAVEDL